MRYAELLESRRLFATVFQGVPGYYEVWGTTGDDVISIAVDQAASAFTLDGVIYGDVLQVSVHGSDGNDSISVSGGGLGLVSAVIRGGEGDDTLSLGLDGGVWGDGGKDRITIRDAFRGEAHGGDGDDYITLDGNTIDGRAEGDDGNDILAALDNLHPVAFFGGAGDDRLYGSKFGDILYDGAGRDFVFGLGGDDEVDSRDGTPDWIMGGDGHDTLLADSAEGGIHGVEWIFYG